MGKSMYSVRKGETTEVVTTDPIELKTIPAWEVTRAVDGFGWHIGKYATPEAAEAVAAVLRVFADHELN